MPSATARRPARSVHLRRRAIAGRASWFALTVVCAAALGAEALAEADVRARVTEVVDGDTVVLERAVDGADQVRLVGIQAPKLALGREGFTAWPLAEESRSALVRLVEGRLVRLVPGDNPGDRHGRILANLFVDDTLWVQGEMLRLGMARVYTFADNRLRVTEILALEGAARAARRGIWGHPFYAVRAPAETGRHLNSFQLVEGRILDAAQVRTRVYLNFGPDWRTDFTVTLDSAARRLFREAGFDPLSLEGRRVRVRGWLRDFNGPLIEATHPEQIEVLEP
ncbi:MAG TPA: thermonuclease family protein [Rhodospirillales bacterium]|jgi:endonuclease YncB( thermonuclease family)|nr:thermonuclease family protein [Rhodospirillales bacterium]HJO70006.1 thermonuclease family protein [Rhodospirillales bacterium]